MYFILSMNVIQHHLKIKNPPQRESAADSEISMLITVLRLELES